MWCAVFTREQGAWFPNGFSMGHAQLSTMLDPLWHLKESSWYWFDWALSVFHVWIPEMVMVKHSCHKHSLQKKTSSCWVLGVLVAFPQPHKTNRDLDTADIFNWKGHAFSWPLMATDGHWSRHLCTSFCLWPGHFGNFERKRRAKVTKWSCDTVHLPNSWPSACERNHPETPWFLWLETMVLPGHVRFQHRSTLLEKGKKIHESCRKDVLKRTLSRRSHQGLHPTSHVVFSVWFYMFYILLLIQIHLTFKLHILGSKDVAALVKHRKAMPSSSASSTPRSWGIRQPHRAELT